jgi:hypothetical protein
MIREMDELDVEITRLEKFIDRAADSLLTFYVSPSAGFRRSTLKGSDGRSATSTARSLFAIAEYVRFSQERGEPDADQRFTKFLDALMSTTSKWVVPLEDKVERREIRSKSDNNENHFTDSHLLMALSLLPRLRVLFGDRITCDTTRLRRAGRTLCGGLTKHIAKFHGGKIHDDDPATHDFVTLHALRAIDAFTSAYNMPAATIDLGVRTFQARVEQDVLAKLGYHSARVEAEFDPAELLFTAALLERCKTPNWEKLLHRAIEVVVDDQTADGAWVGSRVVAYEKQGLLHIASYEVGLTLTYVAASATRRDDTELLSRLLPALRKVCDLAHANFQVCGETQGWANDRTRWPNLLEGWATAIVLTLLIRYREVLLDVRQAQVLRRYRCAPANRPPWIWADLSRTLRVPRDADSSTLEGVSDPSSAGELVRALRKQILTPIMRDPAERPDKAGLILFGTPGTRKTTMVGELAKALSWPMVTLSPPDFLGMGGLEGFEQAADRVFTDLNRLHRVVILFDECEDFFRPRPTSRVEQTGDSVGDTSNRPSTQDQTSAPETRTIGAFITAGMLPRLQELRDERWNVFVLATNVGLAELDPAAVRPGRFDFAQNIDNPTMAAQLRYLSNHRVPLSEEERQALISAIRQIKSRMPFRAIDVAAKSLARKEVPADVDRIIEKIDQAREQTPPPLY